MSQVYLSFEQKCIGCVEFESNDKFFNLLNIYKKTQKEIQLFG